MTIEEAAQVALNDQAVAYKSDERRRAIEIRMDLITRLITPDLTTEEAIAKAKQYEDYILNGTQDAKPEPELSHAEQEVSDCHEYLDLCGILRGGGGENRFSLEGRIKLLSGLLNSPTPLSIPLADLQNWIQQKFKECPLWSPAHDTPPVIKAKRELLSALAKDFGIQERNDVGGEARPQVEIQIGGFMGYNSAQGEPSEDATQRLIETLKSLREFNEKMGETAKQTRKWLGSLPFPLD